MYYSLNKKLNEQFGCKAYKIALDAGLSCPNRDGTKGDRGCIFCLNGSGDFSEKPNGSIQNQIELAKKRVESKNKSGKYIAYFQSYTNTYGNPEYLKKIFTEAAKHPDIVAVSVATRPDCLGDDVLSVLKDVAKIKPLWVELGFQTMHKESIDYIRRAYDNEVYEKAVNALHFIGAEVITHIILGLPRETKEMMKQSVMYAAKTGTDGIKLQLLHVLKNTDLEKDYIAGMFNTLEMDEYIDILCECVEILPENIVIHRLTGDGAKKHLVAPLWSADKKKVLNAINKEFEIRNVIQGKKGI